MNIDQLIAALKKFIAIHSSLHPDCALFNDIRRVIETAQRYGQAGIK